LNENISFSTTTLTGMQTLSGLGKKYYAKKYIILKNKALSKIIKKLQILKETFVFFLVFFLKHGCIFWWSSSAYAEC